MDRKIILLLLACLLVTACTSTPVTQNTTVTPIQTHIPASEYPFKLHPLTTGVQSALTHNLSMQSDLCNEIDTYGFLKETACNATTNKRIVDEAAVLSMINATVKNNSQWLGLNEESKLTISSIRRIYFCANCPLEDRVLTHLIVTFEPQLYRGKIVANSTIIANATAQRVLSIIGHQYLNIELAPQAITEYQAKSSLLGHGIGWTDLYGNHQSFTIADEDMIKPTQLIVYPRPRQESIELRLAFAIPIENEDGAWQAFVDAVTGELLEINRLR